MLIGQTIRKLRESKNLSQGDIEKRTGLLRCYTSRVENGHTVPAIETLEKYARALEVPLYRLFYEGEGPVKAMAFSVGSSNGVLRDASKKERRELRSFADALARMNDKNRNLLIIMAQKMARRAEKRFDS